MISFDDGIFCRLLYHEKPQCPPLFFPNLDAALLWYGKCVGDFLSHMPEGFSLKDYKLEELASLVSGKLSQSRKRVLYDYREALIDEQYKEDIERYEISESL